MLVPAHHQHPACMHGCVWARGSAYKHRTQPTSTRAGTPPHPQARPYIGVRLAHAGGSSMEHHLKLGPGGTALDALQHGTRILHVEVLHMPTLCNSP